MLFKFFIYFTRYLIKQNIAQRSAMMFSNYFSGAQNVVDIFQKRLVFDFVVSEDEGDSLPGQSRRSVQNFEVLHQITHVVRPAS